MSVRCSQGHENPDGSVFCDECGERIDAQPVAMAGAVPAAAVATLAPTATKLIVQGDGTEFDIAGKAEVLIGREDPISNIYPDVDLTPHGGEEGGVSRMHAKLYVQGDQIQVEDLNSTNFTFVNKQKLTPRTPTPVQPGDIIRLGRIELQLQAV